MTAGQHDITTSEQLRAHLGETGKIAPLVKGESAIAAPAADFIAQSTLIIVATSDTAGDLDVSPKGDPAGFVHVRDPQTLLIPERKGNRLAFGFHNILETGKISVLFFVPGHRETLRVNGTATLTADPHVLEQLSAHGKPAVMATVLHIDEVFFHCGKAVIRSKLWDGAAPITDTSPLSDDVARIIGAHSDEISDVLETDYRDDLY